MPLPSLLPSFTKAVKQYKIISVFSLLVYLILPSISFAAVELDLLPAPDKAGKWGYINAKTKKTVIAPKYISAEFFEEGIARVHYEHKDTPQRVLLPSGEQRLYIPKEFGLIDRTGREILPPEYDAIEPLKASYGKKEKIPKLFLVSKDIKKGTYDKDGNWVLTIGQYDHFQYERKQGVFHTDGHWVLPLGKYENLQFDANGDIHYGGCFFTGGKEYCAPSGYRIEQVNHENQTFIIKSEPTSLRSPKVGVIKWTGESIITTDYHEIKSISQPVQRWVASRVDDSMTKKILSAVLNKTDIDIDEKKDHITFYLLDEKGQEIASHKARYYPYVEKGKGLISYESQGKAYLISAANGELIQEPTTKTIGGKYILFQENGYKGLKNEAGQTILPPVYFELYSLGGDLFAAQAREAIDTSKPPSQYDSYNANYGVIDAAGRVIMPFEYKSIHRTNYPDEENSQLIVQTKSDSKEPGFGLADRKGRLLTPTQYLNAFYFNKKGQAEVYHAQKRRHGVIDHTGKKILKTVYNSIFDTKKLDKTEDIFYVVQKDEKWGVYDSSGKEIVPIQYGYISIDREAFEKGWIKLESHDRQKKGAYNYLTKVSIPLTYNYLKFLPNSIEASVNVEKGASQYHLLDPKGKVIGTYARIESPSKEGDEILVTKNGKISLLDAYGKTRIPFRYERLVHAASGYWWAGDGKSYRSVLVGSDGIEYRIKE